MTRRPVAKNYLPEPRFQLKFVRFLFLGSLVQLALLCGVLFYFVGETHRVLQEHGGVDPRVWPLLQHELLTLFVLLGAVFFFYLATVTAMGVFYSHRIGGPLYAVKRALADLERGKFQELKLRPKDEFQDVTEVFNRAVRALRRKAEGAGEAIGDETEEEVSA